MSAVLDVWCKHVGALFAETRCAAAAPFQFPLQLCYEHLTHYNNFE